MIRINPWENVLDQLVHGEGANAFSAETKAQIIAAARKYAYRNKLPFDGSLLGAIRLAAQADGVIRLHWQKTAEKQTRTRRN